MGRREKIMTDKTGGREERKQERGETRKQEEERQGRMIKGERSNQKRQKNTVIKKQYKKNGSEGKAK